MLNRLKREGLGNVEGREAVGNPVWLLVRFAGKGGIFGLSVVKQGLFVGPSVKIGDTAVVKRLLLCVLFFGKSLSAMTPEPLRFPICTSTVART